VIEEIMRHMRDIRDEYGVEGTKYVIIEVIKR
jgi:hypothetical protein